MALTERLAVLIEAKADGAIREIRQLGKESDTAGAATEKLGARGKVAGAALKAGLAVGVGFAAQKLISLSGDAINAARDLAETQSKVGVLFGDSAKQIEDFADSAARNLGQSRREALDAASTFAVFGKGAGLVGDDLVEFSTDLTTLASDMASFSNTSVEDAITSIGAALRGESEPIRRYGVLLDDATLKQQAMKLGLIATTKDALTPQTKALAAQAEILRQTSDAQGDFGRTSEGLANKQRIAAAEAENARAKLGEGLLPVQLALTDAALDLVPAVSAVAEAIAFLGGNDITRNAIIGIAALAAVSKTLRVVKDSEIASLWRNVAAREASTVAIVNEGRAATVTAGQLGTLAAAEKVGTAGAASSRWAGLARGAANATVVIGGLVAVTEFADSQAQKERVTLAESLIGDPAKLEDAKRHIDDLNAKLKEMKATSAKDRVEAMNLGNAIHGTQAEVAKYEAAVDMATQAQEASEAATGDLTGAMEEQIPTVEDLTNATIALANSKLGYRGALLNLKDSQRQVKDAEDALTEAVTKHGEKSKEARQADDDLKRANIELRRELLTVAEAARKKAEDEAKAAGATDTATTGTQAYRDELIRLRDQMAPGSKLRKYLAGLIRDLDAAGKDRNATLTIDVERRFGQRLAPIEGRASGGPVAGGMPYIVGENEPEVFIPGRSGMVANTRQLLAMLGGQGRTVNVNVTNHYPKPERASEDTPRALRNAMYAIGGV